MRPVLVYFGVRATDGGGCLFKPVSYVSYKFSSVSTKRFPSALSYFLAINPSSPSPHPARSPPTNPVDCGSRSRSVLHISFVPGRTPGGWTRPGFVLPELQGRWPVARKLKLTVKNTRICRRWRSRPVERKRKAAARGAPSLRGEHLDDCTLLRRP